MSGRVNLGPASLLRLHGADARSFAQSQFCNDVAAITPGGWQWNAWLDPQGRVRFFFALIDRHDCGLWLWQPLGDAVALAHDLQRFRFRSRVQIEVVAGWHAEGLVPAGKPEGCAASAGDEEFSIIMPGEPTRQVVFSRRADGEVGEESSNALLRWRAHDVRDGLPLIAPSTSGLYVPQALGLDGIAAISFGKGCYPGQEIAARLHFRGGNKRHRWMLRGSGLPEPGTSGGIIRRGSDGEPAGHVLYVGHDGAEPLALAVLIDPTEPGDHLRIDEVEGDAVVIARLAPAPA